MVNLFSSKVSQKSEYLLKNVTLVDSVHNQLEKGVSIYIKDGIIEKVDDPHVPSNVECIDAAGMYALPGLIDMHVHLIWDGTLEPVLHMQNEGSYVAMVRGIANAQQSLACGVTTLRDVGSMNNVAIHISKIFESGLMLGPTVVAAGGILQPTGGHVPSIGYIADSHDELVKAVRDLKTMGAGVIKVAATGGAYGPEEIGPSIYRKEDLKVIADEAHNLGLKVAAHTLGIVGIDNAVFAGINTIEHGANMSPEALKEMKKTNHTLVPTLAIYKKFGESTGILDEIYVKKAQTVVEWHKKTFANAMEEGVSICVGTDAGSPNFGPHPAVFREMCTMSEYGMSNAEVLQSATLRAAKALGMEDTLGSIEAGKQADIILLKDNPLDDVRNISSLKQVIKKGIMI